MYIHVHEDTNTIHVDFKYCQMLYFSNREADADRLFELFMILKNFFCINKMR